MKAIGKITAKVILGDLLKVKPAEGYREEVIQVAGRIDKVISKPSSLNPDNMDVKLVGDFIATNTKTGEQFQSATLYPMGSGMVDMMANAEPGSMFATRVFLQHSARTVQGYSFDFESAMEVKASDAVLRMNEVFKALPAPKEAEEKHAAKKK